jgi:flavodoxin
MPNVKKTICMLLVLALALCCAACGSAPAQSTPTDTPTRETQVQTPAPAPEQEEQEPEASAENAESSAHGKVLVVYFSATGTTKGVAEKIAALTGAELAEIVPAQPYTAEDLNYHDRTTRASAEQNTPDARPEIANDISLDTYDTVYLGYPIWWGQAPRIMSTFVEGHDFRGITVIPFCTSGSSDIGQSDDTLAEQAGSGSWLQGRRFSGNVSEDELQMWINETGGAKEEQALRLTINDTEVAVDWEDNESVRALRELCAEQPLVIEMSMYGGFEQVGPIGQSLPRNDSQTTTQAGDIVLYSGNQIVIFYGSNSWAYTNLGHITNQDAAGMAALLGKGNVTITIAVSD